MNTITEQESEDLFIGQYRFMRNGDEELIKIPSATGLHGYLVIDPAENIYYQIRLLQSEDPDVEMAMDAVWETVNSRNDSILFPEIVHQGTEDEVLFYISSIPNGEPAEYYIERSTPLPVSEACRLVDRFAGRLRSQKSIPVEEYAIPLNSVWLDSRSSGPRIVLGDIAPMGTSGAEAANVEMCLELLSRLSGNPFETAFRELIRSIKDGPGTLSHLEITLERFLNDHPAVPDFWTGENQPQPVLASLITDREIVEEIVLSPDTGPVYVKPKGFFQKIKYIVGAAILACGAWIGISVGSIDGEESQILTLPTLPESQKEPGTTSIPRLDEGISKSDFGPKKWIPVHFVPKVNFIDFKKPFSLASSILLPEVKEPVAAHVPNEMPEFLELKPLALLPSVTPPGPTKTVAKRMPEFANATGTTLPLSVNMPDNDGLRKKIEKTKLIKMGGQGIESWNIREEGEEVFYRENATKEDRQTGFSRFLRAAEKGDARAQYLAGKCLVHGDGTVKDPGLGVQYLERAVQQDHADAMHLLGVCYTQGWGVEFDEAKATELFQRAVSHDSVTAYFNLAARYAQGKGVPRDPDIAADLFQTGAERGNPQCMLNYARCMDAGFGRKQNPDKATYWFKRAAQAGNADALRWCLLQNMDYMN